MNQSFLFPQIPKPKTKYLGLLKAYRLSRFEISEIYEKLFAKCKPNDYSVIDFLTAYGFGRPREIIKFFSTYIELFPNERDFSNEAMYRDVIKNYAQWFVAELKNEMAIHKDSGYIRDTFELLSNYNKSRFFYNRFKEYYEKNRKSYPNIKCSFDEFLDTLYNFGIIGNTWKISNEQHYSWVYRGNSKKFNKSLKMVVHNAIRKGLSLET